MNRKDLIGSVIVGMALTTVVGTGAACNGGSGTGGTTGTTTTGTTSTTATSTHATTATGTTATGTTATTSTGGGTQLTVMNYLSWCNVSVNGGTASSAPAQTVSVTPGMIPLTAAPLQFFALSNNMWHHTTGDTGAGEAGMVTGTTSAAKVNVSASGTCVWVCCPGDAGHPNPCPTTDQCPAGG